MRALLRGKIHRAVVTEADLDYVGSITIDKELMDEADIWAGEKVLISDIDNGSRFETYTVEGEPGSGIICVNGAAAHLVNVGDKIIIMAFELTDQPIIPNIVLVDENNRKVKTLHELGPSVIE
ncbi:MAG: aspartate 1-decarboxylase [Euryarchaeota archaeon]|nr:aspartate 1-decarboxylase [Euryarchaeota archaeon]